MEEEEARLKALLEQTEDFDERRKIRADLRTVRKKMLNTAEAESNERAARRAERARARKAEEDSSNHTGPAITDKVLAEVDDEETLQTLLNEIPTSQIEDRRRIRARIREVKRKNAEGDKPASRQTRRTRETTETSEEPRSTQDRRRHRDEANNESIQTKHDEPSSVTIETTSNDTSHVTITTTSDDAPSVTIETESEEQTEEPANKAANELSNEPSDEPANKITNEQSDEPSIIERTSDETSGVSIATNADEPEAVTIETSSANHADDESEIKFKLTLRQSKDIRIEQDTEDTVEQSPDVEIDQAVEVLNEEPVATPVEIKIEHSADENHIGGVEDGGLDSTEDQGIESPENVSEGLKDEEFSVEEDTKESRREPVEKVNGEIDDEQPVNVGEGMSVEFKIGGEVNLNIDREEESQNESKQDSGIKEAGNTDTADSRHISKDKGRESNASNTPSEGQPTTKPGSRWPPQNHDKKKHGRVNQVDFRDNLKKSGKIGQGKGVVSLEKKNTTAGAQVDFRAENLKKSGRIGAGTVNLENKISTQGAQVDFRGSSLKPSGKLATGVVHLERKTNTAGAQVDFRGALKKGGSPSVKSPAGSEKKASLKSETPGRKESQKSEEAQQPAEASEQEQPAEKSERAAEDDASTENQDNPPAPIKITIPAPAEKKAPVEEPKPVPTKNEKSSARNDVEPAEEEDINAPDEDKDGENVELPAQVDLKFDLKIDNVEASPAPSVNDKEVTPAPKVKEAPEAKGKTESKYKPRDSYKMREETKTVGGGKNKLFDKLSKFQAKDETTVKPKGYTPGTRSSQKKEPAPADKAVNGIAVKVENTSITAKEPESPVQIEVTEHVEDDGDTHTEVREEKTTKQDGDGVEEKKEVTTTTKTTTPDGGKVTTQTKETKTTTKKTFMDPEMQKRMAQRQKERVMAKREQVSSAKNKRMVFMQKLEANSPAQKGPSNIKRSGSNVDKLLAWCRFKLRDYEGVKLTNFSSSWGDGLAFCALIHLYLPDKVPYEELLAGGDKRRNFEVAFGAATEAGVAELLEVDDMLSCANPEPKSVMTYVSSIYKHFNPS